MTKKVLPEVKKVYAHYTEDYLINPMHPVTVNVIGCGGTGSQVLTSLARMSSSLIALGHPGLFVRAIDPDKVSEANMGRQLFSRSEIDQHKSISLIGKINRFFGYDWVAVPETYGPGSTSPSANITISCVDTGEARKQIKATLKNLITPIKPVPTSNGYVQYRPSLQPYEKPYYWMDFGNMRDRGQVVMGTMQKIKQPAKTQHIAVDQLATIDKLHPEIFHKNISDDQGPSCSLAEALGRQDLFINTNLANMGLGILWKMFRELHIKYHGLYVNLDSLSVNPIKISA